MSLMFSTRQLDNLWFNWAATISLRGVLILVIAAILVLLVTKLTWREPLERDQTK